MKVSLLEKLLPLLVDLVQLLINYLKKEDENQQEKVKNLISFCDDHGLDEEVKNELIEYV